MAARAGRALRVAPADSATTGAARRVRRRRVLRLRPCVARARFELVGEPWALELYWLQGYGGGIFLPFGDTTNGHETYGSGRYLLDSVKGADLGMAGERMVLDFNFAYNPSCSYDPRWACPLTPRENRLPIEIAAGERTL